MAENLVVTMKRTRIDPDNLPEVDRGTLRRIFSYLRPYRRRTLLVITIMIVAAVLNLLPPLLIKRIVDHAIPDRDMRLVLLLCGGMIAGPLLAGALQVGQKYLAAWIGESVMMDLRLQLFRHLHEQPLGWFANARPGEAISRVLNDVQGVGQVMQNTMMNIVDNTIVLTATATFTIILDWRLALIALPLLPMFIIPTRRVGRRRKKLKRSAQARLAELTGILAETLSVSGALLLKVFGTEDLETERLRGKATELKNLSLQGTLVGRWFQMLLGLFENAGPALVFAGGGWLIIHGHMQLGTVVAFVTLLKRLYNPASQLAGVHVDLVTSYAYFDRIFAVLDLEPAIKDSPEAKPLVAAQGRLTFRGVSFSYGAATSEGDTPPALVDIDVDIAPGQSVALVGPSGAGKSTLVSLVPRLYDPTVGEILLDGQDLRTLQVKSLRSHIGVVLQETYLFHASIGENLRYARPGATAGEIEAAARAAQIHDYIAGLPSGYDTLVGERGYRLSGGERQRLAIARAILKDPRILILDEATSALDSSNEVLVQAALEPLLAGRTSLVIAHRLSTIRKADLILVLDRGRIVERGNHAELLASGGLYAKLHREQFDLATQPAEAVP